MWDSEALVLVIRSEKGANCARLVLNLDCRTIFGHKHLGMLGTSASFLFPRPTFHVAVM